MSSRGKVLAALLAAAVLLTGCEAGPSSSGASGTVTKRWTEEARNSNLTIYYITVKEDSGKKDAGRVSKSTYRKCTVGERWPACKK